MTTLPQARSTVCVRQVMTTTVQTLELDDSIALAARIFEREHFHHAVILARGKVFGVLSDRDILKAVSPFAGNTTLERPQDAATLKKRVHQIMSRQPVTVPPECTIADAAHTMLTRRVSCLPIVDDHGALLGILTMRDLIAQLAKAPD